MTAAEADVERAHEGLLLQALGDAGRQPRIEIPDVPAVGDRHVAGKGAPVDEDDAILSEQTVLARIVDETGEEECLLRAAVEILLQRGTVIDLGKTDAGMRSARPYDQGKGKVRERSRRLRGVQ